MRSSLVVKGETRQRHLGDGVYASCDGYQVWLRVEREEGRVEEVAVDRETAGDLIEYLRSVFGGAP